MKKESWLDPITLDDVVVFAYENLDFEEFKKLEEVNDVLYGKYFEFQVVPYENSNDADKQPNPLNHIISLGDFGPIDNTEYAIPTYDNFAQLLFNSDEAIKLYLAWITLVAEKNADRKIDGKTYLETFSEKYNSYIEKIKHSENYKLKIAATNKKDIISSYLKKVNQENKSEPSEPGKQ